MELFEKYVYKIYEKRSFSAAARSLFVSQPSLSARVSRLEKDLGFKIFDRSTTPLGLTQQGRIYIEYLEEILQSENNMKNRIKQLSDMNSGSITIGGLCHSAYCVLPKICRAFHEKYPNIMFKLHVGNTRSFGGMLEAMKNQEMDLILTYRYDYTEFYAEPLLDERVVIAVNRNNPEVRHLLPLTVTREELLSGNYDKACEFSDFGILKDISFFRITNVGNTINRLMQKLDENTKFSQFVISNKEHLTMQYNMLREGLVTIFTSDLHIMDPVFDCDVIVYLVPDCPESRRTLHYIMSLEKKDDVMIKNIVSLSREVCQSIKSSAVTK